MKPIPKVNIFKTYEADPSKNGFRIIWVHSSSKQEDDQARRQKKIDKAIVALEELSPKLKRVPHHMGSQQFKTRRQSSQKTEKNRQSHSGIRRIISEIKRISFKD